MKVRTIVNWSIKIICWIAVLLFFIWAFSENLFSRIINEPNEFFTLLGQHVQLVAISGGLAILLAVPLGIFVTRPRFQKSEWLVVNIANLGQTIPSLAVLALAMSVFGIGMTSAVLALFVYSVLPILQNTIAGIYSVDRATVDAARGMGLTNAQILFRVELPNAVDSILAGVRTSMVINVGTAALAYQIGGGGLGNWIFSGISLFDNTLLISGAVPVTLLAVVIDYFFRGLQQLLVPKGLKLAQKAQKA
ncbi:ABC transporter permease [Bacillaceae bacterium SIJ1]|uniref:ABC transporter permease n=1 Tax=Litoribacterium kuwaitense TaxID=1398745 RepID=UPI0013ECED24|nr:ABC transporter permease [Litoribacterium kuwaitense]NGP44002.1 ABC transporter permease [Litoribacterium kuwaitense]